LLLDRLHTPVQFLAFSSASSNHSDAFKLRADPAAYPHEWLAHALDAHVHAALHTMQTDILESKFLSKIINASSSIDSSVRDLFDLRRHHRVIK
jgi:hypothetical protein